MKTWTIEAFNPTTASWQKLPVEHKSRPEALRGATYIIAKFMVRTQVVEV